MTTSARHIIKKQILEVHVPSRQHHRAVSEQVSELYYREVLPQLSRLFDRLAPPGITFSIDRLSLDLGVVAPGMLDKEWSKRFLDAAEKNLQQLLPEAFNVEVQQSPKVGAHTREQTLETVFITFLETGTLPWWHTLKSFDDFEQEILVLPTDRLRALIRDVIGSSQARRRLALQFSERFFRKALAVVMPEGKKTTPRQELSFSQREALLNAVSLASEKPVREKAKKVAPPDPRHNPARYPEMENNLDSGKPVMQDQTPDLMHTATSAGEAYYIANAGLVLLWPFLHPFFDTLGLLREGAFTDDMARQRAIHLTEYLVSGRTHAKEYELALNKLLCGHPLEEPLIPNIVLSESEQQESEQLLLDVIGHWTALGNTSPAGLQESFLQRDGKLLRQGSHWRLQVEQKAYDMLLASLPWGVGMVKLGWGEGVLTVEWS